VSAGAWAKPFLDAHRAELVAFRRHLHAHPELSYEERETTDLIAQRLQVAGLRPVLLPNECGLTCDIGTGEGPVVALRADIDALAMDDEKDVAYRSQRPGVAHACGHDVHATIVLGAGLALAELLAESGSGRVRLIFEPAEESLPGGAVEVIDAGGLDGVVGVYGLHCDPKVDFGSVAVRTGPLTSATDMFTIELHGPGGHTARPQMTVDLVSVAAQVAIDLPPWLHEAFPGQGPGLVVFGALRAGDAVNVIPSHAVLRGTFRTPDRDVWARAEEVVESAVARLLDGTAAEWTLAYRPGIPPVVNDGDATELLAAAAAAVVGPAGVVEAAQSLGGDSFAWFAERVPSSYARLGVHDPIAGDRLDLHSSTFDVDERAIDVGVQVLVETALRALPR
jgi:amidohydrolase